MSTLFLIFVILIKETFQAQVCDSIAQIEITESSSPGHFIYDLKLTNSAMPTGNFYLSDDLEYFQLLNGRLILRKSIDREEYCSGSNKHQVTVNNHCCNRDCCIFVGISSKDSKKSKFYVRVKILDVNDNAPKFAESIYFFELLENTKINTRISLPIATDRDEFFNSVITYEIDNINDMFQRYFALHIDDITTDSNQLSSKQPTLIVREQIDRELISQLEFTLVAKDGGKPAMEGKTKIVLKILDENDNEPKFSKPLYKTSVKENEIIGAELLSIIVEDRDHESNGRVTIGFAPSTNQEIQSSFQITIARNTAVLRLISRLDYEVTNQYKFQIVAKDNGQPPRSSVAAVEITVLNVNDERPDIVFYYLGRSLSKPFSRIYIDEGNEKDDIVCLVKVSDADSSSDTLSCVLESSTETFFLSLIKTNLLLDYKQTYELRSKASFDRETKGAFEVSIKCTDSDKDNELTQSGKLQVHIKDVNDNPPRFTKTHYYGSIKENQVNEIVTISKNKIFAIDRDEAENGTVEYYIDDVSDNIKHHFTINKHSAVVKVVMGLDFETVNKITLIIGAKDLGSPSLTSSAKLIVSVEDTNDNQLEVEKSFYPFEVYENEPIGTFVGQINVTDKDTDPNNKRAVMKVKNSPPELRPQAHDNADQMFAIDSDSGKIYTKVLLDREKANQVTFNILVYNPNPLDYGYGRPENNNQHRETVEIPISVMILNRNDNSPIMVLREKQTVKAVNPEVIFYRQHLTENAMQDNCVSFPYVFLDLDDIDRSKIKTTMKGSEYFSLNMDHGVVCIVNKLPAKGNYKVIIVANDGDVNYTRSEEFLLNIVVKDDPNINNDRHQTINKFAEPRSNNNDQPIRNVNKLFRNNLLYAIIGSIAAALLLLIIVILVGFKKFTNSDRSLEAKSNNTDNANDFVECQSFFEYAPETNYNNLCFALSKNYQQPQPLNYKSELDFRNLNTNFIPKYQSPDPMIQAIQFNNYPTGKSNVSENYQAIQSQLSSDRNNLYNTLSKPMSNINTRNEAVANTTVSNPVSPVFVTSNPADQSFKTKKSNIKAMFQSTFV